MSSGSWSSRNVTLYIGRQHRLLIKMKLSFYSRQTCFIVPVCVSSVSPLSVSSGRGLEDGILSSWSLMKWRVECDTDGGKSCHCGDGFDLPSI